MRRDGAEGCLPPLDGNGVLQDGSSGEHAHELSGNPREAGRTSSAVSTPQSRFIQNEFSYQNGHSLKRSTCQKPCSAQLGVVVQSSDANAVELEEGGLDEIVQSRVQVLVHALEGLVLAQSVLDGTRRLDGLATK